MKYLVVILSMGLSLSVSARTFYISFTSGLDSNNGITKTTPWKRAPGMPAFAASYTHIAGDQYIFKGSDVWTTSGCFPWQFRTGIGGTSGNPDYYGVDKTWFLGGSWTRPRFDAGGVDISPSDGYNVMINFAVNTPPNWITFDNLDLYNLFWSRNVSYGWVNFINLQTATHITIENCYIHKWTHNPLPVNDQLNVIQGPGSALPHSQNLITNTIIDGETVANSTDQQSSGQGTYAYNGDIVNSTVQNIQSGFIVTGPTPAAQPQIVKGCRINSVRSYDGGAHPDGLFMNGGSWFEWHDNTIFNCGVLAIFTGEGGGVEDMYIWNNLIYGTKTHCPIEIDNFFAGVRERIWNNTLVGGAFNGVRVVNRGNGAVNILDYRNNLIISDSGIITFDPGITVTHYTNQNNLLLSTASATGNGYTLGNLYQPTSVSSPTVGAGQDMSTVYNGVLIKDILAVTRPQSGKWDAGAYEFSTGSPPPVNPGTIVITSVTNSVIEGNNVVVTFSRIQGSDNIVSVTAATANGSATNGVNYTGISTNISWANGDSANKTLSIHTIIQPFFGNKTFTCSISSPTGGATISPPTTQTIGIVGTASPPPTILPGLSWAATLGTYTPSWGLFTNGSIVGLYNTTPGGSFYNQAGVLSFTFTNTPGLMARIQAIAAAPDTANDSVWIDVNNSQPADPANVWDLTDTTDTNTFILQTASKRGTGTPSNPQFPAFVWTFPNATNTIYMLTRENGYFTNVSVVPLPPTNPPVVSISVNAVSAAPGYFNAGDVLPINISFSTNVFITGTPVWTNNAGAVVNYSSGSGSNILTFNYTVALGQNTNTLDSVATNSLALNGGTIKDINGNDAMLGLPAPGTAGSLSQAGVTPIVIDTISPTIALSSPTLTNVVNPTDMVVIPVMYSDLNFDRSTLSFSNLSFNLSGTANFAFTTAINGSGLIQSIVISDFEGTGSFTMSIGPSTARDKALNLAPSTGPSDTVFVNVPNRVGSVSFHNVIIHNINVP